MKELNESSIIICSIVRNAERGLKNNIPVINEFCKYFSNYKVIVYENDSTDNTKIILTSWMRDDPKHITVLSNDTDAKKTIPSYNEINCNPFFSYKRIEKMVFYRNKYLDYIKQHNLQAEYLMVVDLDVASLYLDAILSSFDVNVPEWDAVTAMGYSRSPVFKKRYHDTYALVEIGMENTPQTEKSIFTSSLRIMKKIHDNRWLRVFSAFGGLAIYRFEKIKNLRYKVIENGDSRVEVRCEHYSIFQQMSSESNCKVYINANMVLKYQSITLKLIWNTILRKAFMVFNKISNIMGLKKV